MAVGSFIFVLHSHVPYVRKAGKWPHGEEMLHEIIAETYIPLLNSFGNLYKEGLSARVSLGLTPILLEQLNDKYMQKEFVKYIQTRIKAAKKDRTIYKKTNPEVVPVIDFYEKWYTSILDDYENKYNRDLINAFKFYQDHAGLDILTSAATHGYLPLLGRDSAIWGQLKTGINHYKSYFGRDPTGIWLPECGYRPLTDQGRKGIEHFLQTVGIQYFFTDSHVIDAAVPADSKETPVLQMPKQFAAYNQFMLEDETEKIPAERKLAKSRKDSATTFHPYYVDESSVYVFGRDRVTGMQVWSADWGYPGDYVYREFHKKAPSSGIQYWRISEKKKGLKFKDLYNPQEAFWRAQDHAHHFTHLVENHLEQYNKDTGRKGVVVSSYDTELFGHWWFEGVSWLEHVIRNFNRGQKVELHSAREYVGNLEEADAVKIPESSWGNGGHHMTWLNPDTEYMWPAIHAAEERLEQLALHLPNAKGKTLKLLNQAARELLLLQSSDWPFLISTVQARDYAEKRFQEHVDRFNLICDAIDGKEIDTEEVVDIFDKDNVFAHIDYRLFAHSHKK